MSMRRNDGKEGKPVVPLRDRKEWPKEARLAHGECFFFVGGKPCKLQNISL